jgi:hypothetical protein
MENFWWQIQNKGGELKVSCLSIPTVPFSTNFVSGYHQRALHPMKPSSSRTRLEQGIEGWEIKIWRMTSKLCEMILSKWPQGWNRNPPLCRNVGRANSSPLQSSTWQDPSITCCSKHQQKR